MSQRPVSAAFRWFQMATPRRETQFVTKPGKNHSIYRAKNHSTHRLERTVSHLRLLVFGVREWAIPNFHRCSVAGCCSASNRRPPH